MQSLGEYKKSFKERRRAYLGTFPTTKLHDENRQKWIDNAVEKMTLPALDQYLKEVRRESCTNNIILLDISREIEALVGENPLMYAPNLRRFYNTRLYLTELLNKVRAKK